MSKLPVKYATYSKALPPQPIRVKTPGWGGDGQQKMVTGSQPQPWHCLPWVEGSTYGLELIYPYENECHVVNDGGAVRFDWDFTREPGGDVSGGEFVFFSPRRAARFYLLNTRIDIQAPPGHVVRTEPHPRFFTDETGTVPLAMIGHLQEWWPRLLFVVFKAPAPGQRHIFRKGEPFAQVIFVPQQAGYELERMTPEEESARRALERDIDQAKLEMAENVWQNTDEGTLSNYYKVLARAFARDGLDGVASVVKQGVERHRERVPTGRPIEECLAQGRQLMDAGKYVEAREVYLDVVQRDPQNAEGLSNLGVCHVVRGQPMVGIQLMSQAVAAQGDVSKYHANLGEVLRMVGRLPEAEASFRHALRLSPDDALLMSVLGQTLAQQGKADEAVRVCAAALEGGANVPAVHLRMGLAWVQQREYAKARASFEAALALDPNFAHARQALADLPSGT